MPLNPEEERAFQDIADSLRMELNGPEIVASERHDTYIRELARIILATEQADFTPVLVEEFIGRVAAWGRSAEEADAQVADEIIRITGSILHIIGEGIPDTIFE